MLSLFARSFNSVNAPLWGREHPYPGPLMDAPCADLTEYLWQDSFQPETLRIRPKTFKPFYRSLTIDSFPCGFSMFTFNDRNQWPNHPACWWRNLVDNPGSIKSTQLTSIQFNSIQFNSINSSEIFIVMLIRGVHASRSAKMIRNRGPKEQSTPHFPPRVANDSRVIKCSSVNINQVTRAHEKGRSDQTERRSDSWGHSKNSQYLNQGNHVASTGE